MKSFKEIAEARYAAAADYRVSASGRKVHRMKKIADDPRDANHDGEVDDGEKKLTKESVVPDHMKGKQKPYVSSDGKGNYEVLGNRGHTKATFTRAEHGKDAQKKAQAHLRSKYDEYMKEDTELDEAVDKQEARLIQLARLGLVDKADVSKLRIAIDQLKADKPLTTQQRALVLSVFSDLTSLVTGDDMIFNRMKQDVQKEDYEIIEEEEIIVETKDKDKDDVPFDGPYTKKPSATPGKHGAGYSTARHLARLALQKQQKKQGK